MGAASRSDARGGLCVPSSKTSSFVGHLRYFLSSRDMASAEMWKRDQDCDVRRICGVSNVSAAV